MKVALMAGANARDDIDNSPGFQRYASLKQERLAGADENAPTYGGVGATAAGGVGGGGDGLTPPFPAAAAPDGDNGTAALVTNKKRQASSSPPRHQRVFGETLTNSPAKLGGGGGSNRTGQLMQTDAHSAAATAGMLKRSDIADDPTYGTFESDEDLLPLPPLPGQDSNGLLAGTQNTLPNPWQGVGGFDVSNGSAPGLMMTSAARSASNQAPSGVVQVQVMASCIHKMTLGLNDDQYQQLMSIVGGMRQSAAAAQAPALAPVPLRNVPVSASRVTARAQARGQVQAPVPASQGMPSSSSLSKKQIISRDVDNARKKQPTMKKQYELYKQSCRLLGRSCVDLATFKMSIYMGPSELDSLCDHRRSLSWPEKYVHTGYPIEKNPYISDGSVKRHVKKIQQQEAGSGKH